MMKYKLILLLNLSMLLMFKDSTAKVQLPSFISNGMVLQQKSNVALWGKAIVNHQVTVKTSWNNKSYQVNSDELGNWELKVATPTAGGPYQISITDNEEVLLKDVLIGEVWIASGQSNMEMSLNSVSRRKDVSALLNTSENDKIRLFKGFNVSTGTPQGDVKGNWVSANATSVKSFSAVAYEFARLLQNDLDVPVAIIQVAWGGTKIQSWMSRESLKAFNETLPTVKEEVYDNKNTPTGLFNGLISPLIPYAARGFIWYQGEHNVRTYYSYEKLFSKMVEDWRERWGDSDMSFFYAQIAPWDYKSLNSQAPLLREAQYKSLDVIPNSGMVVLLDVGEEKDIHPIEKSTVAERFFKLASAKTYGNKVNFSGPVYKEIKISGSKAILSFENNKGLYLTNGSSDNFEIAGADTMFYPAEAVVKNNKLIISSSNVKNPVAVRYAFKGWVKGDLYNKWNLPASSFRTDNWK